MADGTYKALSDHGWIRYQCLYFRKRIVFNCGLSTFFTAKKTIELSEKTLVLKKTKISSHYWYDLPSSIFIT